ncbi:putative ester cyclase [Bradyrhizobium sp. LB8.2]|uniref:ester cyclase n=1 Tax=unclassified Bradyrhizobium TaxID=2631580 RepID=UPI00339A947A
MASSIEENKALVDPGSVGFWVMRSLQFGLKVSGSTHEFGEPVPRLTDPDGIVIKIVGSSLGAHAPSHHTNDDSDVEQISNGERGMSLNLEENKALVRRFFTAVESGDFHVFDEIVAQDYNDHRVGQGRGRVTLKQYFAGLHSAFADLKLQISTMVAEGDKAAVLSAVRGTHKGDFAGLRATGREINAMAFQLYRIESGQFAEHWEVADFA